MRLLSLIRGAGHSCFNCQFSELGTEREGSAPWKCELWPPYPEHLPVVLRKASLVTGANWARTTLLSSISAHLSLISTSYLKKKNHLLQVHFSTSYLKSGPCFPSRLKPQIVVGTPGYPPKAYITGFRISLGQWKRSATEPANLPWHSLLPHSQTEDLSQ